MYTKAQVDVGPIDEYICPTFGRIIDSVVSGHRVPLQKQFAMVRLSKVSSFYQSVDSSGRAGVIQGTLNGLLDHLLSFKDIIQQNMDSDPRVDLIGARRAADGLKRYHDAFASQFRTIYSLGLTNGVANDNEAYY